MPMGDMIERIVSFAVDGVGMPSFLCTPEHLDELAAGYLLTQGHVESVAAIVSIVVDGLSVRAATRGGIAPARPVEERIAALLPPHPGLCLSIGEIRSLMRALTEVDGFYGTHCIALKAPGGVHFREDIGRHNAMDKAIGRAGLDGVDFSRCAVAATGRISLEMLLKAAGVGISFVITKKYPSDLSVQIARRLGICIVGNAASVPEVYVGEEKILES